MSKSVLIIANPTARRGRASVERVVDKLIAKYRSYGWNPARHYTEKHGPRERQIVAAHASTADTISVIGGDGTVRETVLGMNADQRTRIPIGFIPMGNANVLAREFGIALDDEDKAIEQLLAGNTTRLDVGAINGEAAFLLMLDLGYFAHVVHTVSRMRGRRATRWMYAVAGDALYGAVGLAHLLRLCKAKVTVSIDGAKPLTTTSIAIANVATYAKDGSLCPDANPTDGLLDWNALRGSQTLRYCIAGIRGQRRPSISQLGKGREFRVRACSTPFVAQIDGDPLLPGPIHELRATVLPDYYTLITPTRS